MMVTTSSGRHSGSDGGDSSAAAQSVSPARLDCGAPSGAGSKEMTRGAAVPANAASSPGRSAPLANTAFEPESSIRRRHSGGEICVSSGTAIRPAKYAARYATTHSGRFSERMATGSPGRSPRARRPAAVARA